VVRWISGAAYALWLTLCTAIAINFPITLNYVSHASYATLPPHPQPPNVFQRLIAIGNIYGATSTRPTWGYALFWLALAASWSGLVVAAVMHMRLRSPGAAPSVPERRVARGRGVLLAALLCTLGVAIWGTAMLAVPVARVDCLHPFRAVSPSTQAQCQQNSQLYPIETLALAPLLTTAPDPANRLASEETVYLFALRTFVLLTLTLLAAPFALLAVWRHGRGSGRGGILWPLGWYLLVLAATLTALWSAFILISPPPRLPSGITLNDTITAGPGIVLLSLAALLIGAALALRGRAAA
jgi:hypothetical protein